MRESRGQALQLTPKSGGALGGANDRTNASAFEASAALHGWHREIQLQPLGFSSESEPDRMQQVVTGEPARFQYRHQQRDDDDKGEYGAPGRPGPEDPGVRERCV